MFAWYYSKNAHKSTHDFCFDQWLTFGTHILHLSLYVNFFISRYVTIDKSWIHHYDAKTKAFFSSTQIENRAICRKGIAVIVLECSRNYPDHIFAKKKQSRAYYTQLIFKLRNVLKEKRREKLKNGVLFHQDNAPSPTSSIAMDASDATHQAGFELAERPPYSLDLAPSNYRLFSKLKKNLREKIFPVKIN